MENENPYIKKQEQEQYKRICSINDTPVNDLDKELEGLVRVIKETSSSHKYQRFE
jgi:hypothetical protein